MNELKHLSEFEALLADYQPSDTSKKVLTETKLALLAAPTSSGRNTILKELIKTGVYHYLVSDTTRKPRINDGAPEKDGVEYWFRTEEEMLADLQEGKFLEAAIIHDQQVSGISIRELRQAHAEGKTAITDIEIVGVQSILKHKPDTCILFVLPPDFDEWQRRIKHRGIMDVQEFKRRLASACKEFAAALESSYYNFVINDSVEHAIQQINAIAIEGRVDEASQKQGRVITQQLLQQTKAFLLQG